MTLPSYPNQIDIESIRTEFGMTTGYRNLNSFHANNNAYVAVGTIGYPHGVATAIPTDGQISLDNFHGAGIQTGSGTQWGVGLSQQALPNAQTWIAFKMIGGGGGGGGQDAGHLGGKGGAGNYIEGIFAMPAGTKSIYAVAAAGGVPGVNNAGSASGGSGGSGYSGYGGNGSRAFPSGSSGGGGGGGGGSDLVIVYNGSYYRMAQAGGGGGGGGGGLYGPYNVTADGNSNTNYNNYGWAYEPISYAGGNGYGVDNPPPEVPPANMGNDGGGGGGGGGLLGVGGPLPVLYSPGSDDGKGNTTPAGYYTVHDRTAGGGGQGYRMYWASVGVWYAAYGGAWGAGYNVPYKIGTVGQGYGADEGGYGAGGAISWYWTTQAPIPTSALSNVAW